MFVNYLLRNNISNKLYMLGLAVAILSYSLWKQTEEMMNFAEENEGALFFIGIAFSFCCYTSAYMFAKWDKWRYVPMIAFSICVSRFVKEIYLLSYPDEVEVYDIYDYINFLTTLWIMFIYYVRYRNNKFKEELK